MDYETIVEKIKPELEKAIDYLKQELLEIRTSRPSTSLVENIEIDCFGKKYPLQSLGTLSLSQNREIIIKPWDGSYIEPIEKAISKSFLGLFPIVDNDCIRIAFPSLSQELREKLKKLVALKTENTVKVIRHWRQEGRKNIDKAFSSGELREDDKFKARKKIDEMIKEYNEKVEKMREIKEKEINE